MHLTPAQHRSWKDDGFLVIPGFFTEAEVETVASSLDRVVQERPRTVTVDDLVTGERLRASDGDFSHAMKINDIYLHDDAVRAVALSSRVGLVLNDLLGDVPVMCNTLNLPKGSQQADHLDTLFMTPQTPDKLVATWMALEDVHPESGPLRYYPGSSHIPTYRFNDGGLHVRNEEMDAWSEYMATEVERRGLRETRFLARRGDLFVWHAWLLHDGSLIEDPYRTRNSLVTHFWAHTDCRRAGMLMHPIEGGLWYERPPQPIPGRESLSGVEAELAEQAAAERTVTRVRAGVPGHGSRPLVERLKSLVFSRN